MKIPLKVYLCIILIIAILIGTIGFLVYKASKVNTQEEPAPVSSSAPKTEPKEISFNDPDSQIEQFKKLSKEELIEKLDNLSKEELIKFGYKPNAQLITDLVKVDVFGKTLTGGELWRTNSAEYEGSFKSKEDCETKIKSFEKDGKKLTYEFIGENDYYYEYKVTEKDGDYSYRCVFYKDSAIELNVSQVLNEGTELEFTTYKMDGSKFKRVDEQSIKTILDLEISMDPEIYVYRYLDETDSSYVYTVYSINVVYGDYGINDEMSFAKVTYEIDKDTGLVSQKVETLIENTPVEGTDSEE